MKIIVDMMGGDNAPLAVLEGTAQAVKECGVQVIGVGSEELVRKLADNGQIITQYVAPAGVPGMDVDVNPNGSIWAIEGITSPDGRVLGKMGHAERIGDGLYQNVDGCYDMKLFQSAKKYFDI